MKLKKFFKFKVSKKRRGIKNPLYASLINLETTFNQAIDYSEAVTLFDHF